MMLDPPSRPQLGQTNWHGLWSLYRREVIRFLKVSGQTLVAPAIMGMLFLAVFHLAFDGRGRSVAAVPFVEFLAPGLIMMSTLTATFTNGSTSMGIAKFMGTYVDTLMPPLKPAELTAGYVLASVTRGLLVAIVVTVAIRIFVPVKVYNIGFIIFHGLNAACMLSLLGLMGAIWANKIDHLASVTNFVITPLSFLSGTFYSIQYLPAAAQKLALFNPFFYLIDGFRFGFIGHADASLVIGALVVVGVNIVLWSACGWMFSTGYKLKS